MGRSPCCVKEGLNRGAWTAHEDRVLSEYIKVHGEGRWRNLPERAGLKRCGKSCRMRWLNYLRPDIKRGNISQDEEELIVRLHKLLGNRWSLIAGRIPGRTDNEIKNYWNTNLYKKVKTNYQIKTHKHKHFNNTKENINMPTKVELYSKNLTLFNNKLNSNQIIVRTKATKCTKNFINPRVFSRNNTSKDFINPIVFPHDNTSIDHRQQSHITKMPRDSGLVSIGQESNFSTSTTIPENSLCNTLFAGSDHQDNDFIMNFDVEDFCISDFLISDYLSDHKSNTSYEGKNEILGLDGKELRFSSDDEILLQEWNGKDYNYESSNFNHPIIPS